MIAYTLARGANTVKNVVGLASKEEALEQIMADKYKGGFALYFHEAVVIDYQPGGAYEVVAMIGYDEIVDPVAETELERREMDFINAAVDFHFGGRECCPDGSCAECRNR